MTFYHLFYLSSFIFQKVCFHNSPWKKKNKNRCRHFAVRRGLGSECALSGCWCWVTVTRQEMISTSRDRNSDTDNVNHGLFETNIIRHYQPHDQRHLSNNPTLNLLGFTKLRDISTAISVVAGFLQPCEAVPVHATNLLHARLDVPWSQSTLVLEPEIQPWSCWRNQWFGVSQFWDISVCMCVYIYIHTYIYIYIRLHVGIGRYKMNIRIYIYIYKQTRSL